MRWRAKSKPQSGLRRIVTRFLWLPERVGDEWRWLERATVLEESFIYRQRHASKCGNVSYSGPHMGWEAIEWLDNTDRVV